MRAKCSHCDSIVKVDPAKEDQVCPVCEQEFLLSATSAHCDQCRTLLYDTGVLYDPDTKHSFCKVCMADVTDLYGVNQL